MELEHSSGVAPISAASRAEILLPEILGEILAYAAPDGPGPPLTRLLRVCKWWHEVALLTHYLWAQVHIALRGGGPLPAKQLDLWFRRAGSCRKMLIADKLGWQCPLHDHADSLNDVAEEGCVLQHLLAYLKTGAPLHRLVFTSTWHFRRCVRWLLQRLQASASPSWHSIQNLDWDIPPDGPTLARLPPSISSMKLQLCVVSTDRQQTVLDPAHTVFSMLTSLSIWCLRDLSPVATLLRFCVNLQHLGLDQKNQHYGSIEEIEEDRKILSQHEPIFLPRLTSLTLNIEPPRHPFSLLRLLRTPSLKTVITRHAREAEEIRYLWNALDSLRLLSPSFDSPSPTHVTLFSRSYPASTVPAAELFDIFSSLSASVQHVTLINIIFDVREFIELQGSDGASDSVGRAFSLLPGLQTFEMIDPGPQFDLPHFLRFMKGLDRDTQMRASNSHQRPRRIVFKFTMESLQESADAVSLQQYRDVATLQEVNVSFGIVMDLFVIPESRGWRELITGRD